MPGMLDQLLKQSQPGINPQLEEMISRLMLGSGSGPVQAQGSAAQAARMPLPQSNLGVGGGQQMPGQGEGNETYKILINAGVPPELARQALDNPQLMQTLIMQIQKGVGPQEAPPMQTSGTPARPSAPPIYNPPRARGGRPY